MADAGKLAGHEPAMKVGGMRVPVKERRKSSEGAAEEGDTPNAVGQIGLEGPAGAVAAPIVDESGVKQAVKHHQQQQMQKQPTVSKEPKQQIHNIHQPR
mmetsp:Transcript_46712/g.109870  ORF Transcript_46712/g.109870 Transcript_46712/m.109870 type:complete len:99 (+) Transcript_46712:36-332(+)|eukprot:CAMPEP_0175867248 /NCGR_PEP_ID=MMETSP0107_2-20121207/34705_1 /TAXON_ID=195067 ORGANISM="Goniomonas pacifica, Strain CCMP1869" /NCGR_SAMPLE_ID=MMETSP0107_2 /ASSEMBLY_ACC=CAM_ASM_000203 /LENGTH=98 /DNA_ID=CAMNT_0017184957 /DNA_START=11 /DNA_END=307 /DNA_ORIENTATION=+